MWAFDFIRDINSGEEITLNSMGAFLLGKIDVSLQLSSQGETQWKLIFPDYIKNIPIEISSYGRLGQEIKPWNPTFWITRPLILNNRAAEISGSTIEEIQDFPLEDLLRNDDCFYLSISLHDNQRIPHCRNGSLVSLSIETDNYRIAENVARLLNGRVVNFESLTFAYSSELKYLIRPPISTHIYHPEGVLTDRTSLNSLFSKKPNLLTRHCLICGQTGSGKTNTAKVLLDQVASQNKQDYKILVLDNKGEYTTWAKKNRIPYYRIGESPDLLRLLHINPFLPGQHTKLSNHLEILSMILSVSGFTGSGIILPEYMKFVLYHFYMELWHVSEEKFVCLLNMNGEKLVGLGYPFHGEKGETLPFRLSQFWKEFMPSRFDSMFSNTSSRSLGDLKSVLSARINALAYSPMIYFSYQETPNFSDQLLENSYVLSFRGSTSNDLVLLTSLFTFLFCQNAQMRNDVDHLKNVLLVEEAHLFLKRGLSGGEIVIAEVLLGDHFERMLAELRSKGVGIILVDQSPSQLVKNVIANTGTKIIHQLTLPEDITEIGDSIGLSEANELMFLPPGHCYQKILSEQPQKEIVERWLDSYFL